MDDQDETTRPIDVERLAAIRHLAVALTFAPTQKAAFELLSEIDRLKAALVMAESEARRYAHHYPQSSDGWNTFVMLADRIAEIAGAQQHEH